jgi:hypothetical protein
MQPRAHTPMSFTRMRRPARLFALLAVASLVSSATLLVTVAATGSQRAVAATTDSSFSKTETITRDHLINGQDQVVDTRTVTAKVDVTQNLKDRSGVHVTWSGAHPTGGVIFDQTSTFAEDQEYPVAILQCRGVDSTTVPAAQQLSPQTCYTQVPEERYQPPYRGQYPPYRADRYASPADRTVAAGAPSTIPASCVQGTDAQHWVPFVAADGTTYYGGPQGCAGLAPEQSVLADPLNPPSTTFGTTAADGTGSATFIVQNSDSNASLGCSDTVACSIVIIPIMGISCDAAATALPPADRPTDPAGTQAQCTQTGFYAPGVNGTQTSADPNVDTAVSGQLWWSASNWRNRITVPITMAQTAAVCDVTGGGAPENVYGSQYAVQLTQQWAPKFCLDSNLFRLQQVQASEVQAKNLLANGVTNGQYLGVKAALQAGPPATPFLNPVVQAPTAVTGFAIAFSIDDAKHHAVTQLKLNARLLAKLMTMSYPALPSIRDDWATLAKYQALANNPLDVTVDPEFLALNPAANDKNFNQFFASTTLFTMSSDSDVMTALTSYINADPEARAWLNGQPDPWGMVVNPNYRKIALPVTSWPLKDTYYNPLNNECISDNKSPILPLIAGPVSDPSLITFNMQYGISNAQVNCVITGPTDSPDSRRIAAEGREQPGQRFLLGLVALADAQRYQLNTAQLETQQAANAPAKFSDSTGRTFVAPTQASLLAAAKLLTPNKVLNTFTLPYDKLRTDPSGAQAYPGTLLLSTDVPTKGLTAADGANYGKLLSYAAGPGQVPGSGNGQLPDGYLPITAADGLGSLLDYTTRAATEVGAQSGRVPLVTGGYLSQQQSTPTPTPTATSTAGHGSTGGSGSSSGGTGSAAGGSAGGTGSSAAGGKSTAAPAAAPSSSQAPQVARLAGATHSLSPGWLGYAVPFLAIVGLLSALTSAWLSGVGRR